MSTSIKNKDKVFLCYNSLIRKALSLDIPECIIEIHLFIFYFLQKLLESKTNKYNKELRVIRKNLIKQAIHIKKPLLFLYDLQLFRPIIYIYKLQSIRRHSAELRLWICYKLKHC